MLVFSVMRINRLFYSPTKGKMTTVEVVEDLVDFVHEQPEDFYRLVVGTDSKSDKPNGRLKIDFVTAVVIHRKGKGGRYFWTKTPLEKIASLRDKIYTETLLSIQMAEEIVPQFTKRLNGERYRVEIHIDVGDVGPTREMIREVVGMVHGNGFAAKTKPYAYGAFVVADRHT